MSDLAQTMLDFGFHLGGSRRMAMKYPNEVKVKPTTDWDFYCSKDKAFVTFLGKNNFNQMFGEEACYTDTQVLAFYKHESEPIEVIIRKNVKTYKDAFESISLTQFLKFVWKSSPFIKTFNKEGVKDFMNCLFVLSHKEMPKRKSRKTSPSAYDDIPF